MIIKDAINGGMVRLKALVWRSRILISRFRLTCVLTQKFAT
jgi:hypothetical protein